MVEKILIRVLIRKPFETAYVNMILVNKVEFYFSLAVIILTLPFNEKPSPETPFKQIIIEFAESMICFILSLCNMSRCREEHIKMFFYTK